MTMFISIFSILMVIMVNMHSTNSGAVPGSKNLQERDVLPEVRMQRSALAEPAKKRGKKLGKKKQRSGKKGQKSAKKNQKKSAKKQERKSRRRGGQESAKKRRPETKPAISKQSRMSGRQNTDFKFQACDYLDLVEVGYRQSSDYNCAPGQKFLFKAANGLRRQFLMTPETNIIVLLARGQKVDTCNDVFRDVTERVKCKPVNGVDKIKSIKKKVFGDLFCRPGSDNATTVAPATAAPGQALGSDTKVTCRCPDDRFLETCFTTVQSTGNMHTVICNNITSTTIACGSELYGRDMGILGVPLTKYNHPLCSVRSYLAVHIDLEWSCKDPSVPVPASGACPSGVTTAAATTAGATTAGATTAGATTAGATTAGATTAGATTGAATTAAATTAAATTAAATTAAATTAAATTAAATTAAATTAAATTAAATTAAATTAAATTAAATTAAATTAAATTAAATTAAATTAAATTAAATT